jgi:hypothetical protein
VPVEDVERLLTPGQVRVLGIAFTTLESLADEGRLPATRTPGGHRPSALPTWNG